MFDPHTYIFIVDYNAGLVCNKNIGVGVDSLILL
jgi:hypothetical protein